MFLEGDFDKLDFQSKEVGRTNEVAIRSVVEAKEGDGVKGVV